MGNFAAELGRRDHRSPFARSKVKAALIERNFLPATCGNPEENIDSAPLCRVERAPGPKKRGLRIVKRDRRGSPTA
jgi:hypothetical protein